MFSRKKKGSQIPFNRYSRASYVVSVCAKKLSHFVLTKYPATKSHFVLNFVTFRSGDYRYITYVYTPDGKDVSLLMIQAGMAWHFKKYDSNEKYSNAEIAARKGKKGLWYDEAPIAPWIFRKTNK